MRQANEGAREALRVAIARIHSFAAAHNALYRRQADLLKVEMREYLQNLANHLEAAISTDSDVDLSFDGDILLLPRDRAVSIGLVVNELVTNAVKHAFTPGQRGHISIEFRVIGGAWRLIVADNGKGMRAYQRQDGLGSGLIAAFAQSAGGEISVASSTSGTRVILSEIRR
jgi:two-component sensor histidine kinase